MVILMLAEKGFILEVHPFDKVQQLCLSEIAQVHQS